MRDTRMRTLARNLIHNSLKLQPGEKVLIEMHGHHPEMVNALLEAAYEAQVLPFLWLRDASTRRAMLMGATLEQIQIWAELADPLHAVGGAAVPQPLHGPAGRAEYREL